MFRERRIRGVSRKRQGYLYYQGLLYSSLSADIRAQIRDCCREASPDYWRALLERVTTEHSPAAIAERHHISECTLRRALRRYYEIAGRRLPGGGD